MSEVKHTATPWNHEAAREFDPVLRHDSAIRIYATDPGPENDFTIGFVCDVDKSTREAHANFIVTAYNSHEELVEALKKLPLDSFGDDMSKHDAAEFADHAGEFFEAMIAARAALAKEAMIAARAALAKAGRP